MTQVNFSYVSGWAEAHLSSLPRVVSGGRKEMLRMANTCAVMHHHAWYRPATAHSSGMRPKVFTRRFSTLRLLNTWCSLRYRYDCLFLLLPRCRSRASCKLCWRWAFRSARRASPNTATTCAAPVGRPGRWFFWENYVIWWQFPKLHLWAKHNYYIKQIMTWVQEGCVFKPSWTLSTIMNVYLNSKPKRWNHIL